VFSVIDTGLDDPVAVTPELDVTVKVVIVEFPVPLTVNGTDTTPDVPPEAVPIVGACGLDVGKTELDAEDAFDVPAAFVAVIVNV